MRMKKLAMILVLGAAMPALAQLTTLVRSVEAAPSMINVPTSASGRLQFKPCAEECDADYISVRLTPATLYIYKGKAVSFSEFRRNFFNQRRSAEGYALVSYDTEKNTATSVEVSF